MLDRTSENTLTVFYEVLKSYGQYIRFALLTSGIKSNKVSVFSDLINLRDISCVSSIMIGIS
ncbi:AAA family ATPase [Phocaeicola plebeius]|uniref:AAA family ATPase n=1 Tax=Phocaeicola plebeius TaxID=310297 RepID=UPI0034E98B69